MEQILNPPPAHNRQALEQEARLRVGRQDHAARIDRQQPGAECMQVFGTIVQCNQHVSSVTFPEQTVLDLCRSHGNKRARVLLSRSTVG